MSPVPCDPSKQLSMRDDVAVIEVPPATQRVLRAIAEERARINRLIAEGRFLDYYVPGTSDSVRLAILAEEFGEAAKEVMDGIIENDKFSYNPAMLDSFICARKKQLRKELIQVATVATAWVEALNAELGS